jgi:DNA replication protein DnaC
MMLNKGKLFLNLKKFSNHRNIHKNLIKIENNQKKFNFPTSKEMKNFDLQGWPIFERKKEEILLEKYLKDSNTKKNSIFVVGQEGIGKSTIIRKFEKRN